MADGVEAAVQLAHGDGLGIDGPWLDGSFFQLPSVSQSRQLKWREFGLTVRDGPDGPDGSFFPALQKKKKRKKKKKKKKEEEEEEEEEEEQEEQEEEETETILRFKSTAANDYEFGVWKPDYERK